MPDMAVCALQQLLIYWDLLGFPCTTISWVQAQSMNLRGKGKVSDEPQRDHVKWKAWTGWRNKGYWSSSHCLWTHHTSKQAGYNRRRPHHSCQLRTANGAYDLYGVVTMEQQWIAYMQPGLVIWMDIHMRRCGWDFSSHTLTCEEQDHHGCALYRHIISMWTKISEEFLRHQQRMKTLAASMVHLIKWPSLAMIASSNQVLQIRSQFPLSVGFITHIQEVRSRFPLFSTKLLPMPKHFFCVKHDLIYSS